MSGNDLGEKPTGRLTGILTKSSTGGGEGRRAERRLAKGRERGQQKGRTRKEISEMGLAEATSQDQTGAEPATGEKRESESILHGEIAKRGREGIDRAYQKGAKGRQRRREGRRFSVNGIRVRGEGMGAKEIRKKHERIRKGVDRRLYGGSAIDFGGGGENSGERKSKVFKPRPFRKRGVWRHRFGCSTVET